MKRIVTICLLLAFLVLAGCTSLPGTFDNPHGLVGRWENVRAEGSDIRYWQSATMVGAFWFKSDGTCMLFIGPTRRPGEPGISATYTVDGQAIQLTLDGRPPNKPAAFRFEDNLLVVSDPNFDLTTYYKKK